MWKDLDESWDVLQRSAVVRHLALNPGTSFHDAVRPHGQDLDNVTVDEMDVPVPIPADGSQLRAVALAAEGHSFVLEGPPGTGKSQTITNLIAHTLSLGKSVLFVAEKQAALDVVKRRLEKIGLSDFTLDLHGKNQSPQAIRDQLKKAIDFDAQYNERMWDAKLATLRARHAPLVDYPRSIHDTNGAGYSAWSAFETLIGSPEGPSAQIPPAFVSNLAVPIEDIHRSLIQFERSARTARPSPNSEWNIVGSMSDATSEQSLLTLVHKMHAALTAAHSSTFALGALTSSADAEALRATAERAQLLSRYTSPSITLLDRASRSEWPRERDDLLRRINDFQQSAQALTSTFTPAFVATGDPSPAVTSAQESLQGLFGKKKRVEAFLQLMQPHYLADTSLPPDQALPLLEALPAARSDALDVVARMKAFLLDFAPDWWSPFDPAAAAHLGPLIDHIESSSHVRRHNPATWSFIVECGVIPPQDYDTVFELASTWTEWTAALGTTPESLARWRGDREWHRQWVSDNRRWMTSLESDGIYAVQQRSIASGHLDPLRAAGLRSFVDQLLTGAIDCADAELSFMRGVAETSTQERRRRAGLTHFDVAHRYGEVEDYSAAADEQRAEQIVALRSLLLQRRPFRAGALTDEVGQLRRLLDAKRGGQTFRQLIMRYPEHIVAATPCFFVSPTSLAQFVPPGSVTFDVVVFDEASQVTVPQAVGALGRGRSAVIVGDSQQMPPTAVGKATAGDGDDVMDDEEVIPEDLDSILTEAVESGIPRQWLSWHYRSQDESLIAFSNEKYYEGRLASLPTPGGDDSLGVEWRRVDGHFNRENTKQRHRTNLVEAQAIVAEVRRRLNNPYLGAESIGIVTFNAQQQTLVRDLLEECRDPLVAEQLREDKHDGLFIKNLENVQGDERDVILFSTAFSKKRGESKLSLNFGPLTRTGGEKRWNVAITRARRKVVVFTSFDPTDIDLNRTNSLGMAHLRGYLERASQTDEVEAGDIRWESVDKVTYSLAQGLMERGLQVRPRFGLSDFVLDLVVRRSGAEHWQVAVLTDGEKWAARPTVSDRDMTPMLLESMMGWGGLVRVWLPEWIDNSQAVLDRIAAAVVRATDLDDERRVAREFEAAEWQATLDELESSEETNHDADSPVDVELRELLVTPQPDPEVTQFASVIEQQYQARLAQSRDIHDKGSLYVESQATPLGSRDDLERDQSPSVRATIVQAIRDVVETEGPIEVDRLCRHIGSRFGFDRLRAARKEAIERCIPVELIRRSPTGDFVWPANLDAQTWNGFRTTQAGVTRPLSEICPEEIANAMMYVAESDGLARQDLFRSTLAQFNQKRLTGLTSERLELCLDLGLRTSRLMRFGDVYKSGA